MFPLKHEEVASFDVLTLASREHACSMEEQTVALRGSQWFLSLGSVTSGLEKSLLASYGESTPAQNALRMSTKFNIRSALTWLESVTEKETGNAHPAACVDVFAAVFGESGLWLGEKLMRAMKQLYIDRHNSTQLRFY